MHFLYLMNNKEIFEHIVDTFKSSTHITKDASTSLRPYFHEIFTSVLSFFPWCNTWTCSMICHSHTCRYHTTWYKPKLVWFCRYRFACLYVCVSCTDDCLSFYFYFETLFLSLQCSVQKCVTTVPGLFDCFCLMSPHCWNCSETVLYTCYFIT